jgi:hypothetical protein
MDRAQRVGMLGKHELMERNLTVLYAFALHKPGLR